MKRPHSLQRLVDEIVVTLHGGARLRLRSTAEGIEVVLSGGLPAPSSRQLLALPDEFGLSAPGTIDLARRSSGGWLVRTRGRLASRSLEQRLRNWLAAWADESVEDRALRQRPPVARKR